MLCDFRSSRSTNVRSDCVFFFSTCVKILVDVLENVEGGRGRRCREFDRSRFYIPYTRRIYFVSRAEKLSTMCFFVSQKHDADVCVFVSRTVNFHETFNRVSLFSVSHMRNNICITFVNRAQKRAKNCLLSTFDFRRRVHTRFDENPRDVCIL